MPDLLAGDVITGALRELVRQFDETERAMLTREPEGVHEHRSVVRRLRSTLKVFRDLFDPFAVDELRLALREWGAALGVVRDREVAAAQAESLLADIPSARDDPRLRERLIATERAAAEAAYRRLLEIHELERLRATRARLHDFAANPPMTPDAAAPASVLKTTLAQEGEDTLRKAEDMTDSLESQHEYRKSARGLRYAVEAAMIDPPGLFGRRTRRVGTAAHRIQKRLGDHRDAVLLVRRIERARVRAGRAQEQTSGYDDLAAAARTLADDALTGVDRASPKLADAVEAIAA